MCNDPDTIFALASASGRAGVAIVRVSGTGTKDLWEKICRPSHEPEPRKAVLRKLVNPQTTETIDHAVVINFPAPASYTGEDVMELHVHGGRAILDDLTEILRRLPGFRLAEPGEFTRRAFENGKLDLTEAEAVADLVDAETTAQRKQAVRQMEGELGRLYFGWANRLKHKLAFLEADIDFVDDELPEDVVIKSLDDLKVLSVEIEKHLDDNHRGERLREGFMVAILGPPNAGKSSLLNALARREAAIVTPVPGTTRDIIDVHLNLGDYPVTLADTAGLCESLDAIESEGVRRALQRAAQADLKILLLDGSQWPRMDEATMALRDANTVAVVNKADLFQDIPTLPGFLFVSVAKGQGLDELIETLIRAIEKRFAVTSRPVLTRVRHRAALETCRDHLRAALLTDEVELRAEDVRLAMRALGRITGHVDVEDLLDVIFSEFCIGK